MCFCFLGQTALNQRELRPRPRLPLLQRLQAIDDRRGAHLELEAAQVSDLDEERGAWLVRAFVAKTRRPRWRISLLHRQGVSWAEIGERVGQQSKLVTADTYTHALIDSAEVDRAKLLARVRAVQTRVQTSAAEIAD